MGQNVPYINRSKIWCTDQFSVLIPINKTKKTSSPFQTIKIPKFIFISIVPLLATQEYLPWSFHDTTSITNFWCIWWSLLPKCVWEGYFKDTLAFASLVSQESVRLVSLRCTYFFVKAFAINLNSSKEIIPLDTDYLINYSARNQRKQITLSNGRLGNITKFSTFKWERSNS